MTTVTLNGPTVKGGVKNVVLRDAVFHSPVARYISSTDYYVIKIGIREDTYTSWIGTLDQSKQRVDATTPISILNADRPGMRLKENQTIVIEVAGTGVPQVLRGSRINFRMAQVGGHYDGAKPLVSGGGRVGNSDIRAAVKAIERQVNGRLAEWEESVQLNVPGTHYDEPTSDTLTAGTSSEDYTDLTDLLDGNVYHVTEVAATPGYDLAVNFTGIEWFNAIVVRGYYNGGTTHACRINLYNYTNASYDTLHTMMTSMDYQHHVVTVPDDYDYLSNGSAKVQFYHSEAGNVTHDLYIDWCVLAQIG